MRLIQMLNFYELVIFLCLTSVVTSMFVNEPGTSDDINRDSTAMNKHVSLVKDIQSSTSRPLTSLNINSINFMDNTTVAGEGGPIHIKNTSIVSMDEHNPLRDNISAERHMILQPNNNHTETKTKIVPRKGADQFINHTEGENIQLENSTGSPVTKPVFEPSTAIDTVYKNKQTTKSFAGMTTNNTINTQLNVTEMDNKQNASHATSVPEKKISINETRKPTHKPKPTLTIGGPGKDKPIRIAPTTSTLDGMPRKIDYIVPVIITVVTLPLLAVVALVMYRHGRDCWDKRHYRRMDFLIDGMYND